MIYLSLGDKRAEIDPLGAELIGLYKGGTNLLWCRDATVWGSSAPLLFPICGRLRDNTYRLDGKSYYLAPHGFAAHSTFEIKEQNEHRAVLELPSNEKSVKNYPFTYSLRAIYDLCEDGLYFTFEIENKGDETLYFSCGGHWGFALKETLEAYSLRFDTPVTLDREILDGAFLSGQTERVLTDSDTLALDYRICDNDTFVFKNAPSACTLMHGDKAIVRLEYPDTPHLLLWTLPGQKYLCIEPWNGMPDGKESTELSEKDSICAIGPNEVKNITHKIIF